MDPAAAKQQIAERVKQASKFLVTVNANPTVDQLAACIGLTLMLNKMGKHATAVFSGKVPSTIQFLQPEKTIEAAPDSLRDFIISLDKNKADKLRYKVEDDVVRIFITPYKTSISEKDLIFSEGDFNVEVVIALGVTQRSQLDSAITAHGRILHDATVISINTGQGQPPDIGQTNWVDAQASSLSEMLVSISEAFGGGLIDSQIATAFLTGIVAETERFSNKKTSPKVMTMSAQLMAAGANQQLIVSKLEPPAPIPPVAPPPPPPLPPPPPPPPPPKKPTPPPKPPAPPPKPPVPKKPKQPPLKPEGVIQVPKEEKGKEKTDIELGTTEIHIDEQGNLHTNDALPTDANQPLAQAPAEPSEQPMPEEAEADKPAEPSLPAVAPPPPPPPPLPLQSTSPPPPPPPPPIIPTPMPAAPPSPEPDTLPPPPPIPAAPVPPISGHAFIGNTAQPSNISGFPNTGQPDWAAPYDLVPMDPLRDVGASSSEFGSTPVSKEPERSQDNFSQGHAVQPPSEPIPVSTPVDSARSAVESALASAPFDPAFNPPVQSLNTQSFNNNAPLHATEAPPVAPNVPPMSSSDTPMLVLPTGAQPQLGVSPVPQAAMAPSAPPPMPPPLVAGPGAVVPTPPQQ